MLRNVPGRRRSRLCGLFLNEVLSLNAQEFGQGKASYADIAHFLNEVLSLNAQEW